ncbi:LIM domain and actin-binding protein 1 [Thoreauomyces humboldtii]|nr:LIM domain and actin-binding protein 1 [Thoreauomyces humboldtii]
MSVAARLQFFAALNGGNNNVQQQGDQQQKNPGNPSSNVNEPRATNSLGSLLAADQQQDNNGGALSIKDRIARYGTGASNPNLSVHASESATGGLAAGGGGGGGVGGSTSFLSEARARIAATDSDGFVIPATPSAVDRRGSAHSSTGHLADGGGGVGNGGSGGRSRRSSNATSRAAPYPNPLGSSSRHASAAELKAAANNAAPLTKSHHGSFDNLRANGPQTRSMTSSSSNPPPSAATASTTGSNTPAAAATATTPSKFGAPPPKCHACNKSVYIVEQQTLDDHVFHKTCLKCTHCKATLKMGNLAAMDGQYYCKPHFKQLFKLKGNYAEGFGQEQHKKLWNGAGGGKGAGAVAATSPGTATAGGEGGGDAMDI